MSETDVMNMMEDFGYGTAERTQRAELVRGLRQLAMFLEDHPQVPMHSTSLGAWVYTKEELQKILRGTGAWEKQYGTNNFYITKRFPGGLELNIYTDRGKVCERVVVGTKEVPEQVIPARTEEIVEWRCGEGSVLGGAESAGAGVVDGVINTERLS